MLALNAQLSTLSAQSLPVKALLRPWSSLLGYATLQGHRTQVLRSTVSLEIIIMISERSFEKERAGKTEGGSAPRRARDDQRAGYVSSSHLS